MCYDRESEVRKVQDLEVRDIGLGFNLLSCAHSCSLEEYPTISDRGSYYKYGKYGEVVTEQSYIDRDQGEDKVHCQSDSVLALRQSTGYGEVRSRVRTSYIKNILGKYN